MNENWTTPTAYLWYWWQTALWPSCTLSVSVSWAWSRPGDWLGWPQAVRYLWGKTQVNLTKPFAFQWNKLVPHTQFPGSVAVHRWIFTKHFHICTLCLSIDHLAWQISTQQNVLTSILKKTNNNKSTHKMTTIHRTFRSAFICSTLYTSFCVWFCQSDKHCNCYTWNISKTSEW